MSEYGRFPSEACNHIFERANFDKPLINIDIRFPHNYVVSADDKRPLFEGILAAIAAGFFLLCSPVYAQETAQTPSSLNGHWVTPNGDFASGKPEDRGALGVAKIWSDENAAVGVAIYVTPAVTKEKAGAYGKGLMRVFAMKEIPANYYIQYIGENTKEGISFGFFVHGYFLGTYGAKDSKAGLVLTIDAFNGEPYIKKMLDEGSL